MIEKLRKVFREDQIYHEKKDLDCFCYDASMFTGTCVAAVRPDSIEQIRDLIGLARRFDFSLTIRGSGTSNTGSATPNDSVIVDMSFFNKIKIVNTKDKWVEVEPFVTIEKLNSILKAKGLTFPLEHFNPVSTIGGLVATNNCSKYSFNYGPLKDFVLGMEYVDGSGKVFYADENNSYKELIGSEGCFALITKIRLKVVNFVKKRAFGKYSFQSVKELLKKVDVLRNGDYSNRILSIFFVSKSAYLSNQRYDLFIEYDTTGISFEVEEEENLILKTKNVMKKIFGFVVDKISKFPWNVYDVDSVISELNKIDTMILSRKYNILHDPKLSPEKYFDFVRLCEINSIPLSADLGNGIFYPRFSSGSIQKQKEMYDFIFENDGVISGSLGIGLLKKEYLSEEEKDSFCARKMKFDSDNLLNRDKVIDTLRFEEYKKAHSRKITDVNL